MHELISCINKCKKSLMLEVTNLTSALKFFYRNRIPPLYKEDKIVYTLDEVKAFYKAT